MELTCPRQRISWYGMVWYGMIWFPHLCADHPGGRLSPPEEHDIVAICNLKQTMSDKLLDRPRAATECMQQTAVYTRSSTFK